jgi:hypothetical protein
MNKNPWEELCSSRFCAASKDAEWDNQVGKVCYVVLNNYIGGKTWKREEERKDCR